MAIRTVHFTRQDRDRPLPASPLQQAFWELEHVLQGEPVFHLPMAAVLRGALDVDALARAITVLVTRHETLRTTFVASGDALHQIIAAPGPVALRVHEIAAGDRPAAEALASAHARVPFDLSAAPPLRPHLYRMAADEHLLSLDLHHVAVDGWSLAILWEELWASYDALRAGGAPQLAAHPFDYADFAAWHRGVTPQLREELGFWRRRIGAGIPTLELPVDRPRSAATRYAGGRREFAIPEALGRALVTLARDHGATAWMAYLAVFQAMLRRVTGQAEFGVGTPISTLTRALREGMVGPFLNLVPVRADVSGAPDFLGLLARVRRAGLDAGAHRYVPWLWILGLAPPRPAWISPHFQVMFNFLSLEPGPGVRPAGLEITPVSIEIGAVEFDLVLTITASERGIDGCFEYKTGLFDPATIDRLVDELTGVLAVAVAAPRAPLVAQARG